MTPVWPLFALALAGGLLFLVVDRLEARARRQRRAAYLGQRASWSHEEIAEELGERPEKGTQDATAVVLAVLGRALDVDASRLRVGDRLHEDLHGFASWMDTTGDELVEEIEGRLSLRYPQGESLLTVGDLIREAARGPRSG